MASDPIALAGEGDAPWDDARRILVLRLGALGDVVRTRFAFEGLRRRFPRARFDWLVEDRSRAGLVRIAGLERVVELPRRAFHPRRPLRALREARALVQELRSRDYQLSIDFHSIAKSALWPWLAGVPLRIGYGPPFAREGAHLLLTHRVLPPDPHLSRFARNDALVRFLGGNPPTEAPPLEAGGPAFDPEGLPERFAVLHPGTSPGTEYKRWEPARYAEVARGLASQGGLRSVITWGPVAGERELAVQVVERAGEAALLGPETPDLAAVLALLARSSLFVGGDSGPVHLATLVGRPLVVVVGPTDPVENAPFPGVASRVVRRDVGCNPCREGCPARTCLSAVEPAAVVAAALQLLESAPPAAQRPRGA